jgi:hypothetical protein
MNQDVWWKLGQRRNVPFSRAEKVAEFFEKEGIRFDPADLDAWGNSWLPRVWPVGRAHHIPEWLAHAFVELTKGVSPKAICDPWAGVGFLIGVLRQACGPKEAIALTQDNGDYAIGKVLVPEVEWHVGETLRLLDSSTKEFDLVASVLPMGLRTPSSLTVSLPSGEVVDLTDDLGNRVMVSASLHLSLGGLGLFVVTPSFFFSRRSVFRQFGALGLGTDAAIALPPGTFAPYTKIGAYLVRVRRRPAQRMFVAELSSDQKTNVQVFNNFQDRQEGGTLELGRFVEPQSFRGLSALRAEDQIRHAEMRFGTRPLRLLELAKRIRLGRLDPEFEFPKEENAIFVPLIGGSDVVESSGELTLKKQNYAQIVVDPKYSSARFVSRFLNSEFGRQVRQAKAIGAMIPKLNRETLGEIPVFVPDPRTQREILEIETQIAAEQNTLSELEIELADLRNRLKGKSLN